MNYKFYVLTPWIEGMNLKEYSRHLRAKARDDKYQLPFTKPRTYILLHMFRNYLKQAKIFHDLGLILGDPKSANAMVDTVNGFIEIIDLDAIHPIGTRGTSYTHKYLPPWLISSTSDIFKLYAQADDIYIFGLMLAELFPHIFTITYTEKKPTQITEISSKLKPLRKLVLQMTNANPRHRPLIQDCLKGVDTLITEYTPQNVPEPKGNEKIDLLEEILKKRVKYGTLEKIEILQILKDADFYQTLKNQNYIEFSQHLEEQKVKRINIRFEDGSTPLTRLLDCKSISEDGIRIMSDLLRLHVNLFVKDGQGRFPLKMVREDSISASLIKKYLQPLANIVEINIDEFFYEKNIFDILKVKFSSQKQKLKDHQNHYKNLSRMIKQTDSKSEQNSLFILLTEYESKLEKINLTSTHIKYIMTSFNELQRLGKEIQLFLKEPCYLILKLISDNLIVDINERMLDYQLSLDKRVEFFKRPKTKDKLKAANTLREHLKSLNGAIYSKDPGKMESSLDSGLYDARNHFISAARSAIFFGKNLPENDEKFIKKMDAVISEVTQELKY